MGIYFHINNKIKSKVCNGADISPASGSGFSYLSDVMECFNCNAFSMNTVMDKCPL